MCVLNLKNSLENDYKQNHILLALALFVLFITTLIPTALSRSTTDQETLTCPTNTNHPEFLDPNICPAIYTTDDQNTQQLNPKLFTSSAPCAMCILTQLETQGISNQLIEIFTKILRHESDWFARLSTVTIFNQELLGRVYEKAQGISANNPEIQNQLHTIAEKTASIAAACLEQYPLNEQEMAASLPKAESEQSTEFHEFQHSFTQLAYDMYQEYFDSSALHIFLNETKNKLLESLIKQTHSQNPYVRYTGLTSFATLVTNNLYGFSLQKKNMLIGWLGKSAALELNSRIFGKENLIRKEYIYSKLIGAFIDTNLGNMLPVNTTALFDINKFTRIMMAGYAELWMLKYDKDVCKVSGMVMEKLLAASQTQELVANALAVGALFNASCQWLQYEKGKQAQLEQPLPKLMQNRPHSCFSQLSEDGSSQLFCSQEKRLTQTTTVSFNLDFQNLRERMRLPRGNQHYLDHMLRTISTVFVPMLKSTADVNPHTTADKTLLLTQVRRSTQDPNVLESLTLKNNTDSTITLKKIDRNQDPHRNCQTVSLLNHDIPPDDSVDIDLINCSTDADYTLPTEYVVEGKDEHSIQFIPIIREYIKKLRERHLRGLICFHVPRKQEDDVDVADGLRKRITSRNIAPEIEAGNPPPTPPRVTTPRDPHPSSSFVTNKLLKTILGLPTLTTINPKQFLGTPSHLTSFISSAS